MNNDKDKVLDKSLLGFVVDTNNKDENSEQEIQNTEYLTTLLFEQLIVSKNIIINIFKTALLDDKYSAGRL